MVFQRMTQYLLYGSTDVRCFQQKLKKNSKVFEQKGDLLNFKANIDPRAMLSQIKLGRAETS